MGNSFTVFIDPGYTFEERVSIGEAIIRFVKARTINGRGVGGAKFGSYSANYKKTKDFEIAKKGQRRVNLILTGEMLSELELLDASIAGRIVIGYQDGDESDKSIWMKEKGYNFMGVSEEETEKILRDFRDPSASLSGLLRRLVGS